MYKFIGTVILLAIVVGSIWLWRWREQELDSALRDEVQTLAITKAALETGQIPQRWDAATFISAGMLDEWVKSFVGTRAELTRPTPMQVEVTDAGFKIARNLPEVTLEIRARRVSGVASNAGIQLRATGILVYRESMGVDKKPLPALPEGKLALRITRLKPVLVWNELAWTPPRSFESLFAQGLNAFLEKELEFDLALAQSVTVPVVGDADEKIETNDGKGSVTLRRTSGLKSVEVPVSGSIPVVVSDGVWIVSAVDSGNMPKPEPLRPDLQSQGDLLRDDINRLLRGVPDSKSDVAAWIGKGWVEALIAKLNATSDEERRLAWQSIEVYGKLLEDDWGGPDGLHGGAYVELAAKDAASAAMQLGRVSTDWNEQGLEVRMSASASASARVHAHIDPYIGGGFGVRTTIDARPGALQIAGRLQAKALRFGDQTALAVGFVPQCQDFELNLLAGGSIEFGARIYPRIGDRLPAPAVLAVSGSSIESPASPAATDIVKPDLDSWPRLHVGWKPVDSAGSTAGYLVAADVDIARATSEQIAAAPSEVARRDEIQARAREQWRQEFAPDCPARRDVVFLLADQDFGPNNEIVKALKFLGDQVARQGHNLEVAWRDLETVLKDPRDVGKVAENIARRAGKELDRLKDRIEELPGKAEHELRNVVHGLGRALGI